MKSKPVEILYVEDDMLDVDLAKTALNIACDAAYKMEVVEDGEKALQFLNRRTPYEKARVPDVILLDLNLPKIHGRDVLKSIKAMDATKRIPVIILTTSQRQEDIDQSYELGACGYLTKPNELKEYQETFKAICDFWFKKANFPSKPSAVAN